MSKPPQQRNLFTGRFSRVPERRNGNAEGAVQIAIVEYVRWCAPQVIIFHPANGGWRTKAEAARFKAMGVMAGALDLVLALPGGRVAFWEVKAGRGQLSPDQRAFTEQLERRSHSWAVVRSVEDARAELQRLGIRTKEAQRPTDPDHRGWQRDHPPAGDLSRADSSRDNDPGGGEG